MTLSNPFYFRTGDPHHLNNYDPFYFRTGDPHQLNNYDPKGSSIITTDDTGLQAPGKEQGSKKGMWISKSRAPKNQEIGGVNPETGPRVSRGTVRRACW